MLLTARRLFHGCGTWNDSHGIAGISKCRCHPYRLLSVLDVEGVAQRPVEVSARLDVEVADSIVVEERDWNRDHVVATDHAGLRQAFGRSNLHLGSDTANSPGDRCARDGGQHGERGITSQHANRSPTCRRTEIGPYDVAAGYHSGTV